MAERTIFDEACEMSTDDFLRALDIMTGVTMPPVQTAAPQPSKEAVQLSKDLRKLTELFLGNDQISVH